MYSHVNPKNDKPSPLIAEDVYKIIVEVGTDGPVQLGAHAVQSSWLDVGGGPASLCWRRSSSWHAHHTAAS